MKWLAHSFGESPALYASIAQALTNISSDEMDTLRAKFDVAYF